MSKGKVLLITTEKQLVADMTPSMTGRDYELAVFPTVRDAAMPLGVHQVAGVVADITKIPPADRKVLFQLHADKGFPLFVLETIATISPAESAPLRRLTMPFPNGFSDQVRAVDRPVVFLADQALYASRGIQIVLQQAGIQTEALDAAANLATVLLARATPAPRSAAAPVSFWEKLTAGAPKADAVARPGARRVVIVQFPGTSAEASALDVQLRRQVPDAVCYQISSFEVTRAAGMSILQGAPASILREQAGKIAQVLAEGMQAAGSPTQNRGKERVLLLESHKVALDVLSQTFAAAGYEVTALQDGEQALKLARVRGAFHLAVLGTALNYAKHAAGDLAKSLREFDPDLRIIFMIDRHPVEAALKGVSEVVALGLDGALLKPVEPQQVLLFAQKALQQRFLLLENERLYKEVKESARALEQVNGFQTKFFAMVAHDVKNPLTAILGYAEVLGMRLKEMPAELKCASHIHSAAKTLNLLISDLVDLAAIESGKLRVALEPLDMHQVLSEVRSRIEVVATQRQIKFSVEAPAQLPPLSGDPGRLGQVIQNLCTNGIQYTKEGGAVSVGVEATEDWVIVSVRDTGIGIKAEDLPRVFERFFQTAEAQQMRRAGFGLGLKISREIVQMHGGDIGLESEFGVGSRFFFTIPVQKPAGAPRSPNPAAPPRSGAMPSAAAPAAPAPAPSAPPAATPIPAPVQPPSAFWPAAPAPKLK